MFNKYYELVSSQLGTILQSQIDFKKRKPDCSYSAVKCLLVFLMVYGCVVRSLSRLCVFVRVFRSLFCSRHMLFVSVKARL